MMIRWLRERWWSIQCNIDITSLWPQCKKAAPSLDKARAIFAIHAFRDPAWIEHYGEERLKQIIDEMS